MIMKTGEDFQPYNISEYTVARHYNVDLNNQIGEPHHYTGLFEFFRGCSPNDVIYIYMNCPGGNVITGQQIINSMNECPAHIVTVLDGMCMSLAPLILFSGDEIVVPDHGIIMFHDFSQGKGGGKGNELLSGAIAWNDFYKEMLLKYAKPFLNAREIDQIVKGQDLYFNADETRKRITKIMKDREKQQQAAE